MSIQIEIRKITTVEDMLPQLELIRQLSPQLDIDSYFRMLESMVPHNYFQVVAYQEDRCVAVSGYWIGTKLYSGKYIEIDNFVVCESHRNKGIGKLMLEWMLDEGRKNGCATAMLDAYVENFDGHHFYYREGFIARGFHYLKML